LKNQKITKKGNQRYSSLPKKKKKNKKGLKLKAKERKTKWKNIIPQLE
jgi:hypothetical protein